MRSETLPLEKQISIILPSFRDNRILLAIKSIRMFDDVSAVRIIVIDGGSDTTLVDEIRTALNNDDILVAEPDQGIFDALNKGLERVNTPYVGWIGSDDLFTGEVLASEVIHTLRNHDVFVASQYLVAGRRIRRLTQSFFAGHGLVRFGLHNPHYSTFGRAELFCKYKFALKNISSDIGYFLNVFAEDIKIAYTNKIAMLQEEGGFSTQSKLRSIAINRSAYHHYREHNGPILSTICVFLKVGYKVLSLILFKLAPEYWDQKYPKVAELAKISTA